jgi:transposase-like protein
MNPKLKDYSLDRMTRGAILAKENVISENANGTFSVPSQTVEEIAYLVRMIDRKWVCNCIDFKEKHEQIGSCYHIHAVKFWIAAQIELKQESRPTIFAEDSIQCPNCANIRVVKFGHDSGKQVFKCRDCGKKFRELGLLKKAQYTLETVSLTLDLYFSGMSLRKIVRTLSDSLGIDMSYGTVYAWIQKFIPRISKHVNSLAPQLSDTWHGDELFVKMKDGVEYNADTREWHRIAFLWNVMDRKTRFLLASRLSAYRDKDGAFQAFKEARNNSHGQFPEKIFVDGARAYNNIAHAQVKHWNPQVIARSGINKPHANNNRIERLNGTLRERVKVQRGWKSMESQIAEGQRIHYNFVKPHMALEGMTPAQRAGIGKESTWLSLLGEALKESK